MSKELFSLAAANAPKHADKTPPLLVPSKRPDAMFDILEERGYQVVGVNEGWRGVTQEAAARALWSSRMPFPNHPKQGMGNQFVYQNDGVSAGWPMRKISHRINDVPGGRTVYSPIIPFRAFGTKVRVPIILNHSVRAALDSQGNVDTTMAVAEKAARIAKRTGRCIALGDQNNPEAWRVFAGEGAQVKHFGVSVIAAWGDVRLEDFEVITAGVDGVWTDHPLLGCRVVERG